MNREVTRQPKALRDLEGQVDYFKEISIELADRFVDAIEESLRFLLANREVGQICNFIRPETVGIRVWAVHGFRNHLVFYRPTAEGIEVVRVLHGAMILKACLETSRRR